MLLPSHHPCPTTKSCKARVRKPGTVPTDLEQSTGIERYESFQRMEGHDPFRSQASRPSITWVPSTTLSRFFSLERTRIVGCTGFPVDSHDTLYMKVSSSRPEDVLSVAVGDPHEHGNEEPKLSVLHEHPGEKPRLKWGWGDMTTHNGGNQR
ncbi:Cytochrome c oxidase subunit 4 [Puccinia graminis f. sp. tritici]|uniref:Cytochrome c oxidase subunit 4 n=1 Tax=Puccinia graminis f. sp. tritici TaxID=56615 RepID=A0A5B0MZG4_PUCGR|nr:Cytochrome c oxidase subunit 4 [Puccinia graminis f. sp. tritici]